MLEKIQLSNLSNDEKIREIVIESFSLFLRNEIMKRKKEMKEKVEKRSPMLYNIHNCDERSLERRDADVCNWV